VQLLGAALPANSGGWDVQRSCPPRCPLRTFSPLLLANDLGQAASLSSLGICKGESASTKSWLNYVLTLAINTAPDARQCLGRVRSSPAGSRHDRPCLQSHGMGWESRNGCPAHHFPQPSRRVEIPGRSIPTEAPTFVPDTVGHVSPRPNRNLHRRRLRSTGCGLDQRA
jgi:hypothetical protein